MIIYYSAEKAWTDVCCYLLLSLRKLKIPVFWKYHTATLNKCFETLLYVIHDLLCSQLEFEKLPHF